jgi:hypothetical protein
VQSTIRTSNSRHKSDSLFIYFYNETSDFFFLPYKGDNAALEPQNGDLGGNGGQRAGY